MTKSTIFKEFWLCLNRFIDEKETKRAVNIWIKFGLFGQCALLKLRENHVTAM
jgi:hypothetical protein